MKNRSGYTSPRIGLIIIVVLSLQYTKASAQVLPEYSAFPPDFSGGLQLGTQGLGVQGGYSFLNVFNVRLGFNGIPGVTFQYKDRGAHVDRSSIYAIVDWQPRYGNSDWLSRKWYVSAGAGQYFSNSVYHEYKLGTPAYSVALSKFRPYLGTGLGNISLSNNIMVKLDLGIFIPTSKAVTTYDNTAGTITDGLRGIAPGLNTAITLTYRFK